MRRTDEQFINEVYLRRDKYKKKKKQRNTLLAFLVPILVSGAFLLPAMLPASASEKSETDLSVVTDTPPENQSPAYPPGTIIIYVSDFDSSESVFDIVSVEAVNLIEKIIEQENPYSSISDDTAAEPSQGNSDSKSRTDTGEKICAVKYFSGDNIPGHYHTFTLYEKGILDEDTDIWYNMTSEKVTELKSLLGLN
ncbi:MAG: hypothetical protein IJ491_09585 [Clostridia bacterium]|nr:hypothetical protein [Clostridia bacterium]